MPSSRECLRRKGATTQSCFVFPSKQWVGTGSEWEDTKTLLRSIRRDGSKGLEQFQSGAVDDPRAQCSAQRDWCTRFPMWRKQHCAAEGPLSFLPDAAVLRQVNGLQLVSIEHLHQGQGVTDLPGCRRGCGVLLLLAAIQKGKRRGARGRHCVSKKESLTTH